ncbi:MAG: thiamine pyrophosphate-binding protein, partial [Raoultibacter sp.]
MSQGDTSADSALFLSAFFDELMRLGVSEVVISPGSRSTPLAMVAFEASRRSEFNLRVFIDIDERGAAFFALGMAKASGRPVCLICTSGTATANYYPAVLEAESSRVPLVILTGDRPPRLQGLGAPQTCDQLKLYGDHARFFQQMPLPTSDPAALAFARQVARQALISACGPATCGPATCGPA